MSIAAALIGASGPLKVTTNDTSVYASRYGHGTVTTAALTATVSGGVPGYTYSWVFFSGDNVFTCNAATSASTTWTATVGYGDAFTAVYRLIVTDSLGHTPATPTYVYVSASENSF